MHAVLIFFIFFIILFFCVVYYVAFVLAICTCLCNCHHKMFNSKIKNQTKTIIINLHEKLFNLKVYTWFLSFHYALYCVWQKWHNFIFSNSFVSTTWIMLPVITILPIARFTLSLEEKKTSWSEKRDKFSQQGFLSLLSIATLKTNWAIFSQICYFMGYTKCSTGLWQ